jgi:hypothetical protein
MRLQGTVECEYDADLTDHAAFEAGVAHTARAVAKYTQNGALKDYETTDKLSEKPTAAPESTMSISNCGQASAREQVTEPLKVSQMSSC